MSSNIDQLCINTIRVIAAEMVQTANSGHPGAPMGLAPVAHTLFSKVMKFNGKNPKWWNRDRFVLSNGHACALLYTMLHLSGFDVSLDDLKSFRQLGSKCPGHPESFRTAGVEVTTGPLGQGIANAVGLSIAGKHLAGLYNKPNFELFNNYNYVICGDGCLQEGVAAEAVSLAGHLQLGNLILLYDDNGIQIDGETDLAFSEHTADRFKSYKWHVQTVTDGDNDINGIYNAIEEAKKVTDKPSIIIVKTTIGYSATKQGTEHVHGSPLGTADLANVKTKLGFNPEEKFVIKPEVYDLYKNIINNGIKLEDEYNKLFEEYTKQYPKEAAELSRRMAGKLPDNIKELLPVWDANSKADATRNTSGIVLNKLAPSIIELVGGSADLTPSNKTWLNCSSNFDIKNPSGRYLRFGVREHAMAAIGNGLYAYGGIIPFTATFLNFIEYAYGAVRLSALSNFQQIYIMTHDSIGLGEDGPTHQPIEALSLCRSTPNMLTFRPADGNEVSGSYAVALQYKGPSVLALSRQNLPFIPNSSINNVFNGAYIVKEYKGANVSGTPLVLIGTGSEVEVALKTADILCNNDLFSNITVVSAPCLELFDQQSIAYRQSVLAEKSFIVAIEAGSPNGWEKYAHATIAMTTFGESAPTEKLYDHFGFTGPKAAASVISHFEEFTAVYDGASMPPVAAQYVKPRFIADYIQKL